MSIDAHAGIWSRLRSQVTRTEIDGVPTFWVDTPGKLVACLMFRVGRSDEPLPWGGITHLVEHLALSTLGEPGYDFNGAVSPDLCRFFAAGDGGQITAFLDAVCSALVAPPADRIDDERRVLRTEALRRRPDPVSHLMSIRYGASGFGRIAYEEYGLRHIGPDQVTSWRDRYFTRDNAVLALSGPPPAGLRLALPEGRRRAMGEVAEVVQEYPTVTREQTQAITVATTAPRGSAATAILGWVAEALQERLRRELALTYTVVPTYVPVSADEAHLTLGADCMPEYADTLCARLVESLEELTHSDPPVEHCARQLRRLREQYVEEGARRAVLDQAARFELAPGTGLPEDIVEDYAAVDPVALPGLLAAVLDRSLWMVPAATTLPQWRFRALAQSNGPEVEGSPYTRITAARNGDATRLSAGFGGLSAGTERWCATVRFERLAAMLAWDGGERVLIGDDGYRVAVVPRDWNGGDALVRYLDRVVAPEARVPMGASAQAPTAQPATPATKRRRFGLFG